MSWFTDNLMQAANQHQVLVCGHYPAGVQIEKVNQVIKVLNT
jgi:hypothetical protein